MPLPLMFVDEACQLGSCGAQQPLHAGLHGLQALDQVLPMAKPLAEVVALGGLEEVHQLFHTLLFYKMRCVPHWNVKKILCSPLKYGFSFGNTVHRPALGRTP